jgi:hypothetical protein
VVAVVRSTELPPAAVYDELDPYERCPVVVLTLLPRATSPEPPAGVLTVRS